MDPGPSSPRRQAESENKSTTKTPRKMHSQGLSTSSAKYRTPSIDRSRRFGRGELHTQSTARKFLRHGQSVIEPCFDDDEMIFGTKIKTSEVRDSFRKFIDRFEIEGIESDDMEPLSYYMNMLKEVTSNCKKCIIKLFLSQTAQFGTRHFCVDLVHVYSFDKRLYNYIVNFPLHVIPLVDKQLTTIAEMELGVENPQPVEFRPYNMLQVKPIRELDPIDMYRMISVEGMITRTSSIIPQIKSDSPDLSRSTIRFID